MYVYPMQFFPAGSDQVGFKLEKPYERAVENNDKTLSEFSLFLQVDGSIPPFSEIVSRTSNSCRYSY